MLCPKCKSDNLKVYDSRPSNESTWRRRMCLDCKCRFSTVEINLDEYQDLKDVEAIMNDMLLGSKWITNKLKGMIDNGEQTESNACEDRSKVCGKI